MIVLDKEKNYSRLSNVLYKDGIPFIVFTVDKFPNFDALSTKGVLYMEKYINRYTHKWVKYKEPLLETGQITLVL